jgi:hypothetical protein
VIAKAQRVTTRAARVAEKVERVTAKVPKVTAIERAVKEPKAVKEVDIMMSTMTNQGGNYTAALVSGQESHGGSTANMTRRYAADTEAAWKGTPSTTVSQNNSDPTDSTTNRSANMTGRRQKQRAQTPITEKSPTTRQKQVEQKKKRRRQTVLSWNAGMACAGRASSEGKFDTAAAENGLYSLRVGGVYDGQDSKEVICKNRAERKNRAESENSRASAVRYLLHREHRTIL